MELGLIQNDDYFDEIIKTVQYENKLHELDNGINLLLDEFKKNYVISQMQSNTNIEEYQSLYQTSVDNLASVLSKLFILSNDVQINIDNINKKLFQINVLIKQEKNKNKSLKRKLGMIENKSNTSSVLIDDYKDIYDKRYLRNWGLLLSSIICILFIGIIYKKK